MSALSKIAKTQIARIPEVVATVVTDRTGTLLESTGDVDAESAGAVHAVSAEALISAGEALGLGVLQRTAIVGPRRACLITISETEIVGIHVDATKPFAAFEKKLEALLRQ